MGKSINIEEENSITIIGCNQNEQPVSVAEVVKYIEQRNNIVVEKEDSDDPIKA